ncbi:MAG: thymidylate synthase [Chloroflexaceae bacterium]|nr:thymidylate synthase [Chloroflexaceae bacterium]
MEWPIYFPRNVTLGNPQAGVGLCLLWTPQDRVLPALPPGSFTLAGNLYSRDGISFLIRNVLARPTIRTLLLCGKDMTGSGAALVALMEHGLDAQHRIVGDGTRLHPELPAEAIDLFRHNVRLVDARDTMRPEAIAALLAELPHNNQPFAETPLIFPYTEPKAEALPAEETGFVVRAATVRAAYLRLLWQVMTFGQRSATQHSSDQRELLDVTTVIDEEPTDPARFSHAPWMPLQRETLGQRQPDGSFSGYLGQFLQPSGGTGVSYTYGDRLRAYNGEIDQMAALLADLRRNGESRRAVASLWNPASDAGADNPPCFTHMQARLRSGRVHLTAYFRSHDMYRAWPANAYGLRALQGLLVEGLPGAVAGELAIISHSAHIYAHDWDATQELLAHHYRAADPRMVRDPRGSFVVSLEPPEIVVRHYTPEGEHLQTWRGESAFELRKQVAPFVGLLEHALYLGGELEKAEIACALGRPEVYRQDRELQVRG